MSTTAVSFDQNTSAALPIKYENVDFAVTYEEKDGKPTNIGVTSSVKQINKLKGLDDNGKPVVDKDGQPVAYDGPTQIAFEQTVRRASVGTLDGFFELIPDKEEQLNIINKGLGNKFNQKINTLFKELEADGSFAFPPVEGAYDATPLLQEPALRTSMSPTDKALKTLGNLPKDQLAILLAKLQALNTGGSNDDSE